MTEDHQPVLLHHRTQSGGSNTPHLIILHGLFGSGDNWNGQAKRLSDDFQVHAFDLRNHGNSPHASGMSYPMMAADVAHTCKHLGIAKTHVIGHSLGGKVAMQLALDNTTLIDRLIVVDIGPRQYPPLHDHVLAGLRHLDALLANPKTITSRKHADAQLAQQVADPAVRAFLLKNLQPSDNGYRLRINLPAIDAAYPSIAGAIPPPSAPVKIPALFVRGAKSDYLPTDVESEIYKFFAQAHFVTIDDAGHWPHAEQPSATHQAIFEFLCARYT